MAQRPPRFAVGPPDEPERILVLPAWLPVPKGVHVPMTGPGAGVLRTHARAHLHYFYAVLANHNAPPHHVYTISQLEPVHPTSIHRCAESVADRIARERPGWLVSRFAPEPGWTPTWGRPHGL